MTNRRGAKWSTRERERKRGREKLGSYMFTYRVCSKDAQGDDTEWKKIKFN